MIMHHVTGPKFSKLKMTLHLVSVVFISWISVCYSTHLQCAVCEPGSFCYQDASVLCPAHSTSLQSSDNISDCVCFKGYFAIGDVCHGCLQDYYCPGNDLKVKCPDNSGNLGMGGAIDSCLCQPGYTGHASSGCLA